MENYIIHPNGKIYSKFSNKFLKPYLGNSGYYMVMIKKKNIYVHHLIANTFISNPNNLPVINHINGNKLDNRVENLEWVTQRQNCLKYHKSKYQGVYKTKSGKFASKYMLNGKHIYIGCFNTQLEAHEAYLDKTKNPS